MSILKGRGFWIAAFFILAACTRPADRIRNTTVIRVNQAEISAQEFSERLALKLRNLDALGVKDEARLSKAKEDTANDLIFELLLREFAKKNKIAVDKAELDAAAEEIRKQYPDDEAFRRAFAEERLSYERWLQQLEFSVLQKRVAGELVKTQPQPTEKELKDLYEKNKSQFNRKARVRLRQIVLAKEDNAKRIYAELQSGSDFSELAKKFSIAPEAAQGGNTGWIEKETLDIFDQAFKMPVGSRSRILQSPFGFHIFEVLQKEPDIQLNFVQAKDRILRMWKEDSERAVFRAWLDQQIRSAKVFKNEELMSQIRITTKGI